TPEDLPPFDMDDTPAPSESESVPSACESGAAADSAPTPAIGSGDWSAIIQACKSEMDISIYSFLSDSSQCDGSVDGGSLTVYAKNPFAMNMIDTPEVLEQIKSVALKVLGRQVLVRVTDTDAPPHGQRSGSSKLDSLSKFGVEFK
ncbi:MAG: hypothetical protein IJ072_07250, partial [Oscillospiraceae bacterium]|nr:hypothetical protein [Oscillospiraceae bacterium]